MSVDGKGNAGLRRSMRRVLLVALACLLAGASQAWAAQAATSLRGAMEAAVKALLTDLFTERPSGRVVAVESQGQLLVSFPGAAPPVDAEYLLVRPASPGSGGFAQMVGAARIAEVRGDMARAVPLWGEGDVRPGDQVTWPSRITIVLLPTEALEFPALASHARRVDTWLELQLLTERRLRVLRAETPAGEEGRRQRLQAAREYGLTVAPLLVPGTSGVDVILRVRSLLTGQTLAQRQATWDTALAEVAPPPAPTAQAPAAPAPTPYGPAIRPAEAAKAIRRADRGADHLSIPLSHAVNAIALGDVDGDGRPELIGITDRQVVVYRWTGRSLEPVATGDPLPRFATYIYVDAADINGNGKDEIVLTAVRSLPRGNQVENSLLSSIAEVRDGRVQALVTDLDRHLRVLKRPGQPPLLLTQRLGTYEPVEGPVEVLEWRDGRYRPGPPFPLPRGVPSVYAFASGDLEGDGRAELALVGSDGRLRIYDREGRPRWESGEDLGVVDALGFAQTPRFPDYRGKGFDATAEQLAVWRNVARRVLVFSGPTPTPEIVTVGNPRSFGLRVAFLKSDESVRGRAFGYGWAAEGRRFGKRWESADLSGPALDLAVGDLDGDGRVRLLALSGSGEARSLDVFLLYDRPQAGKTAGRR